MLLSIRRINVLATPLALPCAPVLAAVPVLTCVLAESGAAIIVVMTMATAGPQTPNLAILIPVPDVFTFLRRATARHYFNLLEE
jgi:hypothetical protein